ncbi:MAG: hypothetical protein U0903_20680 [Planctomycetales bacterium]
MFNRRGSLAHESPELFTAVVHVVENDSDLREKLDGLLTSVGLKHRMYERLDDLLDSEACSSRGCIVLDVPSCGMAEAEVVQLLRQREMNHPLIMIDTRQEVPAPHFSRDQGTIEVLPKPYSVQRLLETVSKALALIRRM